MSRTLSLICDECLGRTFAQGWWIPGRQLGDAANCGDCRWRACRAPSGYYSCDGLDLAVAHHEAGHAVVHRLLGRRIEYARMEDPTGAQRNSKGHVLCSARRPTDWFSVAVGSFAGLHAQLRWHGPGISDADRLDAYQASSMDTQDQLDRGLTETDLTEVARQAEALVEQYWNQIEQVAERLIAKRWLDGPEVHELVDPVGLLT